MATGSATDRIRRYVAGAAIAGVLAGVAACADDVPTGAEPEPATSSATTTEPVPLSEPAPITEVVSAGVSTPNSNGVLDADERNGLIWMREEEQLAHDVYTTLGDRWELRIFENIAGSESSHVDAVIELLDRYGIADPAARNATDEADIAELDANLERGSRNHLRAFTSQLDARDAVYTPTRLEAATFDEIVSGPRERGDAGTGQE